MYFTRSFVVSALLGAAVATTHLSESTAAAVAASETLASSASVASAAASSSASSGASGQVTTHIIQVGGANATDLIFSPNNIQAAVGDLVQFQFNPKNHSVVQSTFAQPCTPIQNITPNKTDAFFSGYMPTNATDVAAGKQLTYTIRVMDTQPIWFYCSQATHCQGGMVGAVNAATTGNKTVAAFAALAKQATENLTPGQKAGQGNTASGNAGAAASSAAGTAAGGAAATASDSAAAAASASSTGAAQVSTSGATGQLKSRSLSGLALAVLVALALL